MSLRTYACSSLALFASLTLVACGDDSPTGGGGATGTGGAGANGGAGGNGVTVTVTSTGTMMVASKVGQACLADSDCDSGGFCITEEGSGWPLGYCSILCGDDSECNGEACLVDSANPFCYKTCSGSGCRDGYGCITPGPNESSDGCFPGCTDSSQCTAPQECVTDMADPLFGLCIEPEKCADVEDNDKDGFPDCADSDCASDAMCTAAIGMACTGATATMSPDMGDNSNGTSTFASQCGGFVSGSGKEDLYSFTVPSKGQLHVEADPTGDGDLALYVRSACDDATTTAGCADNAMDGAATEILDLGFQGGEVVTIFVDSYQPGTEGTYVLTTSFEPAVCGDNTVTLPETCDDGNANTGDGCSDQCAVELDFYCSAATPIMLGTTMGNTATGTSLFNAPVDANLCTFGTGGGKEVLYSYTPATSGMLSIALNPTMDVDMGVYVRTDCLDGATQIGCADVNFQTNMQSEALTVPVQAGVAVTIFVDDFQTTGQSTFSLTLTQN